MATQLNNRSALQELRQDLNAALAAVATKHGIDIPALGRLTFVPDGSEVRCKLVARKRQTKVTAVNVEEITNTESADQRILRAAMARHGICYMQNSKGDTLLSFSHKAPKYCFTYRSARGTIWKCTAEQAQARFQYN